MRPTWHFVAATDIRWLQELTSPRVQRIAVGYNKRLELDARTLQRGLGIIERALGGKQHLTRTELAGRLERARLPIKGQRLAHLMMHAELEAVICSGPRRGKQFTYALVSERAPHALGLSRDEALATLSRRFFTSHGPATVRDFVWWSGLTSADAKRGLEMNRATSEVVAGLVYWSIPHRHTPSVRNHLAYLLPIYDEYLIAYRDRDAVPHRLTALSVRERVTFQHALILDGQVAGTWRLTRDTSGPVIVPTPLRHLTSTERRAVAEAVQRQSALM